MVTNKLSLTKNSILNGNITILQPKQGFRIGVDSILLASSVNKYSKCLELGTGSGAILVYLSKRFPDSHILGVEKNIELVKLAKKNLKENKITISSANVLHNDLYDDVFFKSNNNKFDRVIMNPPYFSPNKVISSDNTYKFSARYEYDINKWFSTAYKKLKPRGYLNFIFRSESLDLILNSLYPKWGEIKIYPLWPKKNIKSKLMIIQAKKNVKAGVQILPGLVLHNNDGSYTNACNNILSYKSFIELD